MNWCGQNCSNLGTTHPVVNLPSDADDCVDHNREEIEDASKSCHASTLQYRSVVHAFLLHMHGKFMERHL